MEGIMRYFVGWELLARRVWWDMGYRGISGGIHVNGYREEKIPQWVGIGDGRRLQQS